METRTLQAREDPKGRDGEHEITTASRQGSTGHWDRFEVKLSKPSGKQKLGMVLKHVQVIPVSACSAHRGWEKVWCKNRIAYLKSGTSLYFLFSGPP